MLCKNQHLLFDKTDFLQTASFLKKYNTQEEIDIEIKKILKTDLCQEPVTEGVTAPNRAPEGENEQEVNIFKGKYFLCKYL